MTPVVIGWNRRWTVRAAVGSLFGVGVCVWFVHALAFAGFGDLSPHGRLVLAAMFAAFALLFLGTALTYAAASFDASPVVVIDQAGVHDRRLTRTPVPWVEIASVTPLQHGGQLMLLLNVERPRRLPLPANPLWIVNRLSARMFGTELAVKATGLTAGLPQILAAVQEQAPPRG